MTPKLAESILFTDMYQLTMAQLYFHEGVHELPAHFDHFFRDYPNYGEHQAGYCINAGLAWAVEWMQSVRFGDDEIGYLRSQTRGDGSPTFSEGFLAWLAENGDFSSVTMCSIPEGRVVHPTVPLNVVYAPLAIAQILETALLNMLNYQTLIATKAARIRQAGRGQPMLEFGARRAHDKAANAGARAALIGGADFTSNVGISHDLNLPPKGTHAHSMVQAYMAMGKTELDAFRAYADLYPENCLLLVDTINTLGSGIPNAIRVFEELREKGYTPSGIRLDSGDLGYLSVQAAKMLDEAGFPEVNIVLSNEIDELVLTQVISQIREEAPAYGMKPEPIIKRLVYGVGTRLITSRGASALNGVYKLVGLQTKGEWEPAIKLSESADKIPNPGEKSAWRIYDKRGKAVVDVLSTGDEDLTQMEHIALHHPSDHNRFRTLDRANTTKIEALQQPILQEGERVYDFPSLQDMREQRDRDLAALDSGVKRIINPHIYHVSLTQNLWELKQALIQKTRRGG